MSSNELSQIGWASSHCEHVRKTHSSWGSVKKYLDTPTPARVATGPRAAVLDVFQARRRFPPAPLGLWGVKHDGIRKPCEVAQALVDVGYRRSRHRHDWRRLSDLSGAIWPACVGLSPDTGHRGQKLAVIVAHCRVSERAVSVRDVR